MRYEELDSLRGLAALSVFFGHMYLIFYETMVTKVFFEYGALRMAIAGSEAVTLFFVLSGFVLSLPFYSKAHFNYGAYTIKRFCRIYIPYLAVMFIAMLGREMFYTGEIDGLTDWFNVNWSQPLNGSVVKDHLILIGTFTSNINNVVWSLVHEMRISFVFPFLMLALIRLRVGKGIGFAFLLSGISILVSFTSKTPFLGTELYYTIHCTALFVVGALLAKYREYLVAKVSQFEARKKTVLLLSGVILYVYAHPSFVLNILIEGFNPFYRAVIDTWFTAFGASILIIFSISSRRVSNVLKNRFIHYVGKMSYSLYLIHLAVLFSCLHLLSGKVPVWLICVIAIPATFVLSSLVYYTIEKPSMKMGKFLTKSMVTVDKRERGYKQQM